MIPFQNKPSNQCSFKGSVVAKPSIKISHNCIHIKPSRDYCRHITSPFICNMQFKASKPDRKLLTLLRKGSSHWHKDLGKDTHQSSLYSSKYSCPVESLIKKKIFLMLRLTWRVQQDLLFCHICLVSPTQPPGWGHSLDPALSLGCIYTNNSHQNQHGFNENNLLYTVQYFRAGRDCWETRWNRQIEFIWMFLFHFFLQCVRGIISSLWIWNKCISWMLINWPLILVLFRLPAVSKVIDVFSQGAVWFSEVIVWVPIVVATETTHLVVVGAGWTQREEESWRTRAIQSLIKYICKSKIWSRDASTSGLFQRCIETQPLSYWAGQHCGKKS